MKRLTGKIMTAEQAKAIAENFVKQHHSISEVKEPRLEGNTWLVEIDVSYPSFKKFHIRVNAATGQVEGF